MNRIEELEKLAKLKEQGILNQDEFNQEKEKLLEQTKSKSFKISKNKFWSFKKAVFAIISSFIFIGSLVFIFFYDDIFISKKIIMNIGYSFGETPVTVDRLGNIFFIKENKEKSFLVKYDRKYNNIWSKEIGSVIVSSIIFDGKENIWISGRTRSAIEGFQNAGGNWLDVLCFDAFLIKFDNNGNKLWSKQWGTKKDDTFETILTDSLDNIYVFGSTSGSLTNKLNFTGKSDIFIAKLNNDGGYLWEKQIGDTTLYEFINSATIDDKGNLFITGAKDSKNINNDKDFFVLKIDSDGNELWMKELSTTVYANPKKIIFDKKGILTVYIETVADFENIKNKGEYDIFAIKFDENGNKILTEQIGTEKQNKIISFKADSENNLYLMWSDDEIYNIQKNDKIIKTFSSQKIKNNVFVEIDNNDVNFIELDEGGINE